MTRPRKSKSLNGLKSVYWERNKWQLYLKHEYRHLYSGKARLILGSNDLQALKAYTKHLERIGNHNGGAMHLLFDDYVKYIIHVKKCRPSTIESAKQEMKGLRRSFGHMDPGKITPSDVTNYYDARVLSSVAQAKNEFSRLKATFNFALRKSEEYGIRVNPCNGLETIKVQARERLPTHAEMQAVKNHGSDWIKGLLDFIYITGCVRRQDVCHLARSQRRDDGIHIRTSKGGKRGVIPWTPELRKAVDRLQSLNPNYVGSTEYLVLGPDGQPLKPTTYSKRVRSAMKRAIDAGDLQEPFHAHDIRATHATDAEAMGLNPTKQLLHGKEETTKAYLRGRREHKIVPLTPKEADD